MLRLKDVTVYTIISKPDASSSRRVERMALHPGLDDRPMGKGPKFPFRVVWHWEPVRRWMVSCRGKDYVSAITGYVTVDVGEDPTHAALMWLLEGEIE